MRTVYLSQPEYRQFNRRVAKLKAQGINLNISVAQPKKRQVKLTVHTEHNWEQLDTLCES